MQALIRNRKKIRIVIVLLCVFVLVLILAQQSPEESSPQMIHTVSLNDTKDRPFFLGFTPWPADISEEGIDESYTFIHAHGDIVAHHFDTGVPWQESLDGTTFPDAITKNWEYRKKHTLPKQRIYLALTPINTKRDGLAYIWGKEENMPLEAPWNAYRFNDPAVKQAYTQYVLRAIDYFNPEYVSIGIESNLLISTNPDVWQDYLELNASVYTAVKKKYPNVSLFATIQYEHMRGIQEESKPNAHLQRDAVAELMRHSDLFCVSTYHFGPTHNPPEETYFDMALSFQKPLCIAEMGALSSNITVGGHRIKGNEADQNSFLSFILSEAVRHRMEFVINFVNIDYDRFLQRLPSEDREAAAVWVHTGLMTSDGEAKPALSTWDTYFNLPKTEAL